MFNIVICDDEIALIKDLKELLNRYAADTGREFCLFEFHDGIELLENYQSDFDLIFLDIKMEKLGGLKTAEEIRKTDSTVGLFFLTSLSQYVWKGYEYGAINYLLKPMKYGRLKMELDRFFSRYQGREEPYISFSNDSGKFKVLYKDLRYAETYKRNVLLHFDEQEQVIYKSMKEVAFRDTAAVCPLSRQFHCEYGLCEKRGESGGSLNHGRACPDQSAKTQEIYGEVG